MIYIVIGIYLLALAIQFDFRGKGSAATRKFHFRLAFLILVALMAFRYRVGGDTLRYMDSYEHMYGAIDTFDIGGRLQPLWLLLNNFLHSISPKFLLFQIVHVLFINTVFFSFFKKYSKYLFVAIFLYYIYPYFIFNMEVIRESFAIAFFLLSIDACLRKRWLIYYLYIAIAFLFHAGAIFLIIVPFLFNWKIHPLSIFVVCGAGVAVLYFFLNTSFANTYMFLNNIEEQGRAYISIKSNINGYIAPLLFRILFPAIIYYIGIKRGLNKDKLAPLFFFILSVSILTTIFPQLYRLFNYLRLLEVVLCANVLYLIQHTESPRYRVAFPNLYILPILLLIIANQVVRYQFDDTSSIYMNTQKYQLFYPYYSVFNPEISETREMMMRNQFYHNEY